MSDSENVLLAPPAANTSDLEPVTHKPRRASVGDYARSLARDKLALSAVIFLSIVLLSAIFAGLVAPFDPTDQHILARNDPPMSAAREGRIPHLIGTDFLGRDQLSRLIYGARISLAVGFASVLVSGTIGTLLGLMAGYYRGFVDDLIMRAVDVQMGFPSLLLALLVLYVVGAGVWSVIFVLAITRWMLYARVTRSLVFTYRENVFVEAARALGSSDRRIIFIHILPNLMSPIVVIATLEVATMIITEASLSFLGLGIQPPDSSWGLMLAQGRQYVTTAWWLVTFPGLAIFLTALSLNLLTTWIRTVTDPAQRWRIVNTRRPKTKVTRNLQEI